MAQKHDAIDLLDPIDLTPTADVDRFSYSGNTFPWWMLVIWVGFIVFMTWYSIRYMIPSLGLWMDKPPYSKFIP